MKKFILFLVFLLGLTACGPANPPDYVQETITNESHTELGNLVRFGSSLQDHPDWQKDAVAAIEAEEKANPSAHYFGTIFYVEYSKIQFGETVTTGFGDTRTSTTSYYDPYRNTVFLSWWLSNGTFQVGNIKYELANVRCQCESALNH